MNKARFILILFVLVHFNMFSQDDNQTNICIHSQLSLSASADSLQWQFYDNDGWQDFEDNNLVLGAQSVVLSIDSVSASLNGDSIRCMAYSVVTDQIDSLIFQTLINVIPKLTPSVLTLEYGDGINVCFNDDITINAQQTWSSEGVTLLYDWQSNSNGDWESIDSGELDFLSIDNVQNDLEVRQYLSILDAQCTPVFSDSINIVSLPELTSPEIFSEFDNQSICYNTSPGEITETLPASGADGDFSIQWYSVNDSGEESEIGEGENSYTAESLFDTTSFYAVYTSNYGCGELESNSLLFNVLPELEEPNLSPSILGDICYGYDLTIDASGFETQPWLEYQWIHYDELGEITLIGDVTTSIDFEDLTESFSLALEVTSTFDCGTVTSDILELNVLNDLTPPTIDDEINGLPICYGFSPGNLNVTTEATGGSNDFTYEWVNLSDPTESGTQLSHTIGDLTENTTYYCTASDALCGSIDSDQLTIEVLPELQEPEISNENEGLSICYNTSPGDFVEVAPATGANGDFEISWFMEDEVGASLQIGESATSFSSPLITDTTDYYAVYSSTYGCGSLISNSITVNVLPDYETPTLTPSILGDICYGYDLTIDASGFETYPWLEYEWIQDSGGNIESISTGDLSVEYTGLTDDFSVWFEIASTFNCGTMQSDVLDLEVLNELTAPTIDDNINGAPICYDFSPGSINVTTLATGGSESFTYNWYNASSSDIVETGTSYVIGDLQSSQTYMVNAVDELCGGISSNELTIQVLPQLQDPIVFNSNDDGSICYNSSPGEITELMPATGATGEFAIQWFSVDDNGIISSVGNNDISYLAPEIVDTTQYFAIYTSDYNCGSVTSNIITVNVLPDYEMPLLTPSIDGDICFGYDLTIDAVGFETFPWLEYEWYIHDGENSTPQLTDNISIDFFNLEEDFGLSFEISSTYDCGTITSEILQFNVLNELTAPVIDDEIGGEPICHNTSPGALNVVIQATGGSESFIHTWENLTTPSGGVDGLSLPIDNLLETQTYLCTATDALCGPIESDLITVVVYDELLPPTYSLITDPVLCDVNTGVSINNISSPTGGGSDYSYQWFVNENESEFVELDGENSLTLNISSLEINSEFYLATTSNYNCGTVINDTISVEVLPEVVEPVIDFDDSNMPLCYGFEAPIFYLTTPPSGADENWFFTWHSASTGDQFEIESFEEGPMSLGLLYETTEVYARAISAFDCGTFFSDTLIVDVLDQIIPGVISEDQLICYNTAPDDLLSTQATGATGEFTIQWYQMLPEGGTVELGNNLETQSLPHLTETTEYFAVYESTYECGSEPSNSVEIEVLPDLETPVLVPTVSGEICYDSTVVVNAVSVTDYPWLTYEWTQNITTEGPQVVGGDELFVVLNNQLDDFSISMMVTSDFGCGYSIGELNDIDVLNELIAPTINYQVTPENPICFGFEAPMVEIVNPPTGGGETFTSSWAIGTSQDDLMSVSIDGSTFLGGQIVEGDLFIQYMSSDDYGCGSLQSNILFLDVFDEYLMTDNLSNSTVCDDELISNTMVEIDGAGDDYAFQWYHTQGGSFELIAGAESSELLNHDPVDTEDYFVEIVSNYGCGTLYSDTITVNVLEPVVPGDLSFAVLELCANETLDYSATQAEGGTNDFDLVWHQTNNEGEWHEIGSTELNGQVEDVQFTFSGCIEYITSCATVYSDTVELIVNPLPANPELLGPIEVCNGSVDNFYDVDMLNGPWLYSWSINNGVITSGESTDEVLVDWNEGELFSSLELTITNYVTDCSSDNSWEIDVTDISAPSASIVVKKPHINILVSADSTDCATYIWGREDAGNGYIEMFEERDEQYAFFPNLDTLNYHYFVDVTYDCDGIETCPTRNYYLHDPFLSVENEEIYKEIQVYPNPTSGQVEIITTDYENWTLFDSKGNLLSTGQLNNSALRLELQDAGIYIFKAWNETSYSVKRIVVVK